MKHDQVNKDQELAVESRESPRPALEQGLPIYVASRASVPERGQMWRRFREQGVSITSSWIDEDGEGQTEDMADLWTRIVSEIERANVLVLYAEATDFPLKGALIEAGIALGMGKHVFVCLPDVELDPRSSRPIGSWINHLRVSRVDDIEGAVKIATSFSYSGGLDCAMCDAPNSFVINPLDPAVGYCFKEQRAWRIQSLTCASKGCLRPRATLGDYCMGCLEDRVNAEHESVLVNYADCNSFE